MARRNHKTVLAAASTCLAVLTVVATFAVGGHADDQAAPHRIDEAKQETRRNQSEQPDLELFQGRWACTHMEVAGIELPVSKSRDSASGNDFLLEPTIRGAAWMGTAEDGKTMKRFMTIKLVPGGEPKQIDLVGSERDEVMPGIYKFSGDTLTVCVTTDPEAFVRPTRFITKKNMPVALCVYQRATGGSKRSTPPAP